MSQKKSPEDVGQLVEKQAREAGKRRDREASLDAELDVRESKDICYERFEMK